MSDTVPTYTFKPRDALSHCVYSDIKEVQGNQKLMKYISFADHNNLQDKPNTKKKREALWKQDANVLKCYACSFVVS